MASHSRLEMRLVQTPVNHRLRGNELEFPRIELVGDMLEDGPMASEVLHQLDDRPRLVLLISLHVAGRLHQALQEANSVTVI